MWLAMVHFERQDCRRAFEWEYPYSQLWFGDIVGYMFRNHVLRPHSIVAIKLNLQLYVHGYTSPNESFEYSYPLK